MDTYFHIVQYYETDRMGVTHHSNYIRWMEEARIDLLDRLGWGYERFEEEGIFSPVTALSSRFLGSTTFHDQVEISVKILAFDGITMKVGYKMKKGEETVLTGESEHCFLDGDGKLLRLKRKQPELYELLKAQMEHP